MGLEEYERTVSCHVHTFAGEDCCTRFLCFPCSDNVSVKSPKSLQIAVFSIHTLHSMKMEIYAKLKFA